MKRAAALLAVIALGCHRAADLRPDRGDVPVFLISIDTLRSDHLPAYGYRFGSTPAIDALRRDSILFASAFSQVPQTLPSHTTIMTGLLPQDHGVRDNIGYVVPPNTPMLASILRNRGWQTGAAVSAYVLRKATGIAQGFDFYDDQVEATSAISAASEKRDGESTRKALEHWLYGASGRVFAFLHLYDPHAPYLPPSQYAPAYTPYDGEISYADAIVGRFLGTLRSRGLYDRALIVLLSDHGEGLGEHGEDEHGVFVYRYALQVPLMIKLPHSERAGTTVTAPVALTDVAPTILDLLGIECHCDGRNILDSNLDPNRAIYAETYFPRLHLGWSELTSMIDARSHYIQAPEAEFYRWPSDRGELNNVIANDRREAAALRSALERQSKPFNPPSAVDPEDQKKLAALGYAGSTQASGGALPDPKAKIGSLHQFKSALEQFTRGDDPGCRKTLRALLASNPTFSDAYGLLAQSERRSGNLHAAIDALKTAMNRFPGDPHVALALADALWAAGQKQAARDHAALAIHGEPALAHEMLGTFALNEGDLETASAESNAALAAAPERVASLQLAASVADRVGDYAREIVLLDRIVARGGTTPAGVQKQRADVLLRLQRVADAEAALRSETEAYPQNREAWTNLAAVLAAEGRRADAESTLRAAIEKNRDAKMRAMAAETARIFGDEAFARELKR